MKTICAYFLFFMLMALLSFACGDDDDDDNDASDGDDDNHSDDDTDDDDDSQNLNPVTDEGDPAGDSNDEEVDIIQLWYFVDSGVLAMDLEFLNPFDPGKAYIEVFLFHPDADFVSHTVMLKEGEIYWWDCDCSSATKHSGCHWGTADAPDSLTVNLEEAGHFRFSVNVEDLEFGDAQVILTGAGVASHTVSSSVFYADRYPDELNLGSTEITGLAEISL